MSSLFQPTAPSGLGNAAIGSRIATALVAFAFYIFLGDPTDWFDIVTGAISAVVVAIVMGRVVFERPPTVQTLGTIARALVFLPYLLFAVVRANLSLAAVLLDPRLPIDPTVVRLPAPEGRLATALLANSITLTPGTLTVDIDGDSLVVHTLTHETREELLTGELVRAVNFVVGHGTVEAENAALDVSPSQTQERAR
ncbi:MULTISPECIES: Na+/H+ antiporter subunit E [Haloferax]|uniref:Na+/H+ antiporter subunit E n=1 Tax=Haloferax TaxID=2251 RepID=UPI00178313A2|nr:MULTISPECIES: Na+/H+ antiporter subunit E [Haloferax]